MSTLRIPVECFDFYCFGIYEIMKVRRVNSVFNKLVINFLKRFDNGSSSDNIFKKIEAIDWLIKNQAKITLSLKINGLYPFLKIIDDNDGILQFFTDKFVKNKHFLLIFAKFFAEKNFRKCLRLIISKLEDKEKNFSIIFNMAKTCDLMDYTLFYEGENRYDLDLKEVAVECSKDPEHLEYSLSKIPDDSRMKLDWRRMVRSASILCEKRCLKLIFEKFIKMKSKTTKEDLSYIRKQVMATEDNDCIGVFERFKSQVAI